ncbi:MAG: NADH-quinone oxidoreductase subunit L [Planctomycetia bacterium]|nr:NADH-quinone oxidoreductase subunit L [Planctomycetia bacterium]
MDGAIAYVPALLTLAWLLPLASFVAVVFLGPKMGKEGIVGGYVATGAIAGSAVASWVALVLWVSSTTLPIIEHHVADHAPSAADEAAAPAAEESGRVKPLVGRWYSLSPPGLPALGLGYYIDSLTVLMFAMVTLCATCIHVYSLGYMHEELHDVVDHEVQLSGKSSHGGHGHDELGHEAQGHDAGGHGHDAVHGNHLRRPGRFARFFQFLSLFSFSMLGLVIAGDMLMVFVFWELVGICSYFLIGFYRERKSASNAANKAFIVNRIGDFGFLIGLTALWGSLGTLTLGDVKDADGALRRGIFSQVRAPEDGHKLLVPMGMIMADVPDKEREKLASVYGDHAWLDSEEARATSTMAQVRAEAEQWRTDPEKKTLGYWLLVVAGIGVFCGCVGKSAQFPLHVWLPDAMEGPTPVSALVHSATMVAAGVYLVGRFFPVFTPEVLLVIAITGCITLFLAATIAITATDIKRVLAYSTVSQLGYMMLALGMGGWAAGMFHLITHAFFKSLLFLCSGSVIHACHTNDMTKMGGLLKKMPITAYTMLVGCLAIAGAGIPLVIGFSGYYSKDAILAQGMNFAHENGVYSFLLYAAAVGAAITAFYMFRLWYLTFVGPPRVKEIHEHAHESPPVIWWPLVVLAFFAVTAGWFEFIPRLLEQARPLGTAGGAGEGVWWAVKHPAESGAYSFHAAATMAAFGTALAGFLLATVLYGWRMLSAEDVRRQFAPIYRLLWNKWWFDELYDALFVRPVHVVSRLASGIDKRAIDGAIDRTAEGVKRAAFFDDQIIDRLFVDGLVNLTAQWLYSIAAWLRVVQTGKVRQYVLFIVVGTVALFVLISIWAGSGK